MPSCDGCPRNNLSSILTSRNSSCIILQTLGNHKKCIWHFEDDQWGGGAIIIEFIKLGSMYNLFKVTMKINANVASKGTHDLNLIIRLWQNLTSPQLVNFKLSKFVKVEEIDVAQVIGCVEYKICFYILSFLNNKL